MIYYECSPINCLKHPERYPLVMKLNEFDVI